MAFQPTLNQIERCLPNHHNVDILYPEFKRILPHYFIDTPERVAAFLAQCGHESLDFTKLKENLNYSAVALVKYWPKRFDPETAKLYNRNPEKIANKVYANRMGNGPEESGDGWKYRGRGAIQLTGKDNYQKFADFMGKTLDDVVIYLETVGGAIESAAWFWNQKDLNDYADKKDIKGMTKIINGGYNGLEERQEHFNRNLEILSGY